MTTAMTKLVHATTAIPDTSVQLQPQWPWLPTELIGQIIKEAWNSPLSTEERIYFYVSLCNVNRTFLDIFIRTALKDVHLMSPQYTQHYLRLIRDRTLAERDDDYLLQGASQLANNLCRSLTVHVDDLSFRSSRLRQARFPLESEAQMQQPINSRRPYCIRLYADNEPSAMCTSAALYNISMFGFLPHLRSVCIEYVNWGFDDLFDQLRLVVFPSHVENVEIRFRYTGPVFEMLAGRLRRSYTRRCGAGWTTPGVKHLTVSGAPTGFVADLVWTCPNLETLDIDEPGSLLWLAPLPSTLDTLHLRIPEGKKGMAYKWRLCEALDAGLMSLCNEQDVRPKIVVHTREDSGLTGWEREMHVCRSYNVQLLSCASE